MLSRGLPKTLTADGIYPILQPGEAPGDGRTQAPVSSRAMMQSASAEPAPSHVPHTQQDIRPGENLPAARSQHAHQCVSNSVSSTSPQDLGNKE